MGAKLAALGAELVAAATSTTGERRPTPPMPREVMGATLAALGAELVAAATSTTAELFGHQALDHWKGNGDHSTSNAIAKLDPAAAAAAAAGRDKIFVCGVCNRCFGYKHVLQNHERTHTGEKPFECKECHKRFTRDHHLKTHMRLHTGEKPYHCTHCERQFVQVANLRRHLRVHTGERPYACELCTSRFSDSNQLKAHMLIHKGEKPFECPKCLGRFRRRHHLMHHKCPRDDANLGKPRRGRRPKAYDQLLHGGAHGLLSVETTMPDAPVGVNAVVPLLSPPPAAHSATLPPHEKSRRKPSHTIRILTPQQREIFLRDKDNIQTQAIDMSLSPTPEGHPLALIRPPPPARYAPSMEGVLDLSKSRSDDSEAEPIEEEVEGDLGDDDEDDDELMDEDFEDEDDLGGGCSDDGVVGTGQGLTLRLSANSWRDDSSRDSHLSVRSSSSSSHLHQIHRSLVVPPHRIPHMDNGTGQSGDEMSDETANGKHGVVAAPTHRHDSHPQVTMS